jgi:hypothetical protein
VTLLREKSPASLPGSFFSSRSRIASKKVGLAWRSAIGKGSVLTLDLELSPASEQPRLTCIPRNIWFADRTILPYIRVSY